VSVGIERLLSILEEREEKKGVRDNYTQVLVASVGLFSPLVLLFLFYPIIRIRIYENKNN